MKRQFLIILVPIEKYTEAMTGYNGNSAEILTNMNQRNKHRNKKMHYYTLFLCLGKVWIHL